jgi:hypothetical protein
MDNTKIHKIIYFDENSAGDFLNISNDGIKDTSEQESSSIENVTEISLKTKVTIITSSSTLLSVIGMLTLNEQVLKNIASLIAVISGLVTVVPFVVDLAFSRRKENKKLVSTQVKSTILNQFLEKRDIKDSQILRLNPDQVEIVKNSFAFMKFYEPMFKIINLNLQGIDISKFGEVMSQTKGYYELVARSRSEKNDVIKILRLNAEAFRNNYKLTDLLQMDLVYFGIKVGKMPVEKIDFGKALQLDQVAKVPATPQEAFADIVTKTNPENPEIEYDVIDIILAGVENEQD